LKLLKRYGIRVAWVQVGNEINSGLLWPDGHTPHFHRIAALLNSGYTAVKNVYPHALVIVHLANGYDNSDFRWFFDHIQADGAHWDVIGMSLYPNRHNWRRYNREIAANMRDMIVRYHCDVMISEVGMRWNQAHTARKMLRDLLRRTRMIGPHALGVFYWEPEAPPGWNGYDKGALDPTGRFTQAMNAFRKP
jgi:arabinogalactan endo-1,4-beta-galactosidase